jgi:hypothetical protein
MHQRLSGTGCQSASRHQSSNAHLHVARARRSPQFKGPRHQAGLGALGWLIVLAIASFALTCFFKVGPVYLDYWNTKGALEVVVEGGKANAMSKDELRRALQSQLDVSMIDTISAKNIRITERDGVREVDASYEKRVSLLANIDVVVKFEDLKYTLSSAQ